MKKILPLLLLTPTLTNAECTPTPDCASIGYTETSCETISLKCPFDTSKLFCVPCDSSFQYDCTGDNITGGVGNTCAGKYASCECSSSEYIFSKGNCNCINPPPTDCLAGSIYYPNGTCSNEYVSCQNPVGVVVKDNALVMSWRYGNVGDYIQWGGNETNISGIIETSDSTIAQADYDGAGNTLAIVAEHVAEADITTHAAVYCYNYAPIGLENTKNKWYLPSAGELHRYLYANYSSLLHIYTTYFGHSGFSYGFWSSTESSSVGAWYVWAHNGTIDRDYKYAGHSTSCFLAINT